MATYINLGGSSGYLNAGAVVHLSLEAPHNKVKLRTAAGSFEFYPSAVGDRPGEDILDDLLAVLGTPETQPQTRMITLIDGKVDVRYLRF
ncbi:hypothetical protein [Nocardia noduli]|uniref:hypothetical protein n=1 Tax=Nocardia noduli TaxID=2815722 RepID=UPI001C23F82D|nr:hypothetical protein [Nocardia noduli]